MRLIELSPALGGMVGMSMVTLGTGSYKVLVVGGSEQSYNSLYLMEQKVSPYTTGKLVISEVEYNAGTTVQSSISTSYEMTGHSVVVNSTAAIIFGGFTANSLSSAIFLYDLGAADPELGLSDVSNYGASPSARGYQGLAKPDSKTLLMYGGMQGKEPIADLWKLDLATQYWQMVHATKASSKSPDPSAFSAFTSFTPTGSTSKIIVSHGGILQGYKRGTTFGVGSSDDIVYQVKSTGNVYMSADVNSADPTSWTGARARPGQIFPGRCMHSILNGLFMPQFDSILFHGGVDKSGQGLSDMWLMDLWSMGFGVRVKIIFDGATASVFTTTVLDDFKVLLKYPYKIEDKLAVFVAEDTFKGIYTSLLVQDNPNRNQSVILSFACDSDMLFQSGDRLGFLSDYFPSVDEGNQWLADALAAVSYAPGQAAFSSNEVLSKLKLSEDNGQLSDVNMDTKTGYLLDGIRDYLFDLYKFVGTSDCKSSDLTSTSLCFLTSDSDPSGDRMSPRSLPGNDREMEPRRGGDG
eukprot:765919-Hanusia_phi.AAC.2